MCPVRLRLLVIWSLVNQWLLDYPHIWENLASRFDAVVDWLIRLPSSSFVLDPSKAHFTSFKFHLMTQSEWEVRTRGQTIFSVFEKIDASWRWRSFAVDRQDCSRRKRLNQWQGLNVREDQSMFQGIFRIKSDAEKKCLQSARLAMKRTNAALLKVSISTRFNHLQHFDVSTPRLVQQSNDSCGHKRIRDFNWRVDLMAAF